MLHTPRPRPTSMAFLLGWIVGIAGLTAALLALSTTGDVYAAAAILAIVFLLGLVADSVRETFALLVGR